MLAHACLLVCRRLYLFEFLLRVNIRRIEALRYDIPENKDFCLATRTFGHFCAGSPQAKKMTLETVKQHYFKQNFKYRH
jgi:hypothetical protein